MIGYGRRNRTAKVSITDTESIVHVHVNILLIVSFPSSNSRHYMKKEWLTMLMLLFPVMMFMWLISGLFIWALIPPVSYVSLEERRCAKVV